MTRSCREMVPGQSAQRWKTGRGADQKVMDPTGVGWGDKVTVHVWNAQWSDVSIKDGKGWSVAQAGDEL